MSILVFAITFVFVGVLYEIDHRHHEECMQYEAQAEEDAVDYTCVPVNENPNL